MKPTTDWIAHWACDLDPHQEKKTSDELIVVFQEFWSWADLDKKSKSTKQRYSAALHALGGYLVERAGRGERGSRAIREFIRGYIEDGEGPLIHFDNEAWQKELDTVCRKLYKYLGPGC